MAGPLQKSHAIAALVLGAIELVCGILVIILAVVSAKKANLPGSFSPWWAGVVVSVCVSLYLTRFFYTNSVFLLRVKYSYDLVQYKGEIFLMYSYFSE